MIGEIAMAMKTRRTATVRTVTFTELLSLSRQVFQQAARAVPQTAEAMVGYAVKRMRVALWKRVKQKVILISAVNALREVIGMEPLSRARPERAYRSNVLFTASADDLSQSQGGAAEEEGSLRGGVNLMPRLSMPGMPPRKSREHMDDKPHSSGGSMHFFELGMEKVHVPYLEEDENISRAKHKYVRQELHHATSVMSIAAFTTQQMLSRLENTAVDEMDDPRGDGSVESECFTTADELVTLMRRLGTHVDLAAERIMACRSRQARPSILGPRK